MIAKRTIFLLFAVVVAGSAQAAPGHRCLITPDRVAEVGSQVTGVVASVRVERGDFVRSGQLLARLHADAERASVNVAQTRAKADADLKAAQANYEFQRQNLARAEDLMKQNFISQQALEKVRAETKVAQQKLVQAREQREVAQRELELARAQLRKRAIRAPFDGIIAERYVNVGERIEERPMFRIARIDPLRIEVVVPAALFGTVEKGMIARVRPDLPKAEPLDASVTLVDRLIDPASNTFRVRAELPNPGGAVPSGLRCRAELIDNEASAHAKNSSTAKPADAAGPRHINLKLEGELENSNAQKASPKRR
ncbi:MAG: efflux RND transporter periplasmic adaptor subunit [Betaproteobacteria bacterium]|nr:MAG: efflux RND transporter periplasmic adaptor subunit [Betaproteobacteria bacterium]